MTGRGRGGRGGSGGFKHNPAVPLPPKPAEEAETPVQEDVNGNTAAGHEFDAPTAAPPAPVAATRGGRGRGARGAGGFVPQTANPAPPAEQPAAANEAAQEERPQATRPATRGRGGGRGGRGGISGGFRPQQAPPSEKPDGENEESAAKEDAPKPAFGAAPTGFGSKPPAFGAKPPGSGANSVPVGNDDDQQGDDKEPFDGECKYCHKHGHMIKDCPERPASRACYNCGEQGHISRECPKEKRTDGEKRPFTGKCFNCDKVGHPSKECPDRPERDQISYKCTGCGRDGHLVRDCVVGADGEKKPAYARPDGSKPSDYVPPTREINDILVEDVRMREAYSQIADQDEELKVLNANGKEAATVAKFDTWKEADLNEFLLENIARSGYAIPRKIQSFSMPLILEGRDLIAQSETGSGKSAAFLVPLIHRIHPKVAGKRDVEMDRPFAVVLEPTRELVLQVCEQARKLADKTAVRVVKAYGEYAFAENAREVFRGCDLLIATPGRLMHFISTHIVSVGFLEHLVLDEADRLLDEKFGADIDQIISCIRQSTKAAKRPVDPLQVMLFSATFPERLEAFGRNVLREDHAIVRNQRHSRPNMRIVQTFELVAGEDKKHMFFEYCRHIREKYEQKRQALAAANSPVDSSPEAVAQAEEQKKKAAKQEMFEKPRILVFFGSKIKADAFGFYMNTLGMQSLSVSSGQTQKQREFALSEFRLGRTFLLLTTDVCARGLDIKELDHVLNFDMPKDIPSYVQRIGRTGRLRQGFAHSFIDPKEDLAIMPEMVRMLLADRLPVPECLLATPPPAPAAQPAPVVLAPPPPPVSTFDQPPPAEEPPATELGPLVLPPEFSDDENLAGFGLA